MKWTPFLRELSKFLAGLVAGDMLVGLWFLASQQTPVNYFGATFSASGIWVGVAVDAFLLFMLVHYAWHPRVLEPTMSYRTFYWIVGLITAGVAVVHILRLAYGWQFVIGGWAFPMWVSWIGALVAIVISCTSFHFAVRKNVR